MNRHFLITIAAVLAGPALTAQQTDSILVEVDHKVVVRDGTALSADIYRPAHVGRFPVVVDRTPYDNRGSERFGRLLADNGYVYVTLDTRGRYDSEGEFYPYRDDAQDGHDVIDWATQQPWSNGRIGTFGGSYLGFNQWLAAPGAPGTLQTMVVFVSPTDYYESPAHTGGAFNLGGRLPWAMLVDDDQNQDMTSVDWDSALRHLPLISSDSAVGRDMPHFRDWVSNSTRNAYWDRFTVGARWDDIDIPVFHIGGWYDEFLRGTLGGFENMSTSGSAASRQGQRLLVGPWTHNVLGASGTLNEIEFGDHAVWDFGAELVAWYDVHLKDVADALPRQAVRIFVMGENRWADFDTWPPREATPSRLYLHSGGQANTLDGDGRLDGTAPSDETSDSYVYDPADPTPTQGGATCCIAPGLYPQIMEWGPIDQRPVEARSDVLVYTTDTLETALRIAGPVRVRLFIESSAVDTDFTAKLVDVRPDGFAMNLADGIVRARYRDSVRQPSLMERGTIYQLDIDLAATAHTFLPGHQVRLEISSSNFPWYDRNLNTGGDQALDTRWEVATQKVHHDGDRASYVELWVLPGS